MKSLNVVEKAHESDADERFAFRKICMEDTTQLDKSKYLYLEILIFIKSLVIRYVIYEHIWTKYK